MFPSEFPERTTERLLLRRIDPTDQNAVFQGLSDPAVIEFYGVSFSSFSATQEQMEWYEDLWQKKTGIWWAICDKKEQEFLGACGYYEYEQEHHRIEIGYWLLPKYWGKGYVQEALKEVIGYAFDELKVERIEAYVETGNNPSDKVLQKQGFLYEGTMRNCEFKNNKFISLRVFGLLRDHSSS